MARRSKTYVELEGVEELHRAFARLELGVLREVKGVVAMSAAEIEAEAKARVPVRAANPAYPVSKAKAAQPRGMTRDKIKTILRDGGLGASIGTAYFIARFLEQGTKKMAARPFLNPAFQLVRPKYLERLSAALNKAGREASTE